MASALLPWGVITNSTHSQTRFSSYYSLLPVVVVAVPTAAYAAYGAYRLREHARRTTSRVSIVHVSSAADATTCAGDGVLPPLPKTVAEGISIILKSLESAGNARQMPAGHTHCDLVVSRERVVSEAFSVPVSLLSGGGDVKGPSATTTGPLKDEDEVDRGGEGSSRLLETYLRTTMGMFARTPQARIMKRMVAGLRGDDSQCAAPEETFSRDYLDRCHFDVGDRVCGVYVVRERERNLRTIPPKMSCDDDDDGTKEGEAAWPGSASGDERAILSLSAPKGWTGPVVSGVLDCGFVVEGTDEHGGVEVAEGKKGEGALAKVRFVNETVMWRRLDDEPPTLLEGWVGRWFHTLMVRWMVVGGVDAVLRATSDL